MKKSLIVGSLAVLLSFALSAQADNLVQIYNQSLVSDPTFKKAYADWLTAKQDLGIALTGNGVAGSGLFPNIDLAANLGRTKQVVRIHPDEADGYFNSNDYNVTITQPIFNYETWVSISGARFSVKSATATYIAASQDLMARSTSAYFEVLRAYDTLQFTLARKESFLQQLITAEQKFKVGLIAVTGVYDAQASYNGSIADEISDRNNLQDQIENLRVITGRQYNVLSSLHLNIPLVIPQPRNIEAWAKIASKQSFDIQSKLYDMLSAREKIKKAAAGRYPTLDAEFQYDVSTQGFTPSTLTPALKDGPDTYTKNISGELSLEFPVFQGGHVITDTKQKEYRYLSASDQLELTHRTVLNDTRQAYSGVDAGIGKIRADEKAIVSAKKRLEATQAGYVVGTRTMVDVLDAVTRLYQQKEQWADDRYDYIESIISLKQQAGTLSPKDLKQINAWLGSSISFSLLKKAVVVSKYADAVMASPTDATPPAGGQPVRYFDTKQHLSEPQGSLKKRSQPKRARPRLVKAKAALKKMPEPAATIPDASRYAVEVMATQHVLQAKQFVAQQKYRGNFRIVKKDNGYQVIYGDYSSRAQALRAIRSMPSQLKAHNPWVVAAPEHWYNTAQSIPAPSMTQPPRTDRISAFVLPTK